jgi:hypothetical protein
MDTHSDASSWTSSDMEGVEGEVCENCHKIDFFQAFATPMPTFNKILSYSRLPQGRFISTLKNFSASCKLCQEFQLSSGNIEANFNTYHLRAFPSPTSLYQPDEVSTIVSPKNTVWLQAVPRSGFLDDGRSTLEGVAESAQISGWAACYLTTDRPGMFRPQPIPKRFNVAPVKKWLSACMDSHGHICNASVSVLGLLLIDCETLQLCDVSPQPPYVALSYVWAKPVPGNVGMPTYPTIEGQSRLPLEDSLSQVVNDSISVTKQLGFRYLWIDKYCINQSDAAIQKEQIENMDLIYMGAELTIIAAAGNDERHGLPGVGVERNPRVVEIGSFTIMHVPTELWSTSMHSRWGERAWTFQEELLSRRRLFFSEQQVSFICHGMLCCESRGGAELAKDVQSIKAYSTLSLAQTNLEKFVSITKNLELTDSESLSEGIGKSRKERLRELMELLREYTARSLTYDFDALRAFAGIRRVFEEGECPIYNLQGLPVVPSVQLRLGCSVMSLVAALCWEHLQAETARRRTQFPSWTWAGWTSRIHFPDGLENASEFELDSQLISVEYEDGYSASLEALTQSLVALRLGMMGKRHAPRLLQSDNNDRSTKTTAREFTSPKIIQLHAPVVTVELFSFRDPTDWETGSFAGMQFLPYRARLEKDDMPFSPLYILNGLADGTLGCILLRVDKDPQPWLSKPPARAHLLLLQWREATKASRIGKLTAVAKEDESFNLAKLIEKLKWRDLQLV